MTFDTDHDYSRFLKKEGLKKIDDKPNPMIPHIFRMPYSEEEFENKQYSGNYETLSKIYEPGQLVTELTSGPILMPATIKRIGESDCKIEYFDYDKKSNDFKSTTKTVTFENIQPSQLAGPNIFIDDKIDIPNSIENAEYDMNLNCTIDATDLDDLIFAISVKSNKQFYNKLKQFRRLPVRPAVKADFGNTKHITGDLLITVVSARNLSSKYGSGEVYVEIKTYEHNYEEEQFGNFALDDSFQRGKDSMKQMTQVGHMTGSKPLEKNTVFNEEKNMGTFIKGATHDITFIVKQETNDQDIELGVASIKSDDYMDPFRPAKEWYLLLYDPPYFVSSLYLNVLFVPSDNTLGRMGIKDQILTEFNSAYDKWILSRTVYVDKYGFTVSLGKYHPRLVSDKLWDADHDSSDDEDEKDEDMDERTKMNRKRTPEKRVKNAIDLLPALKTHNQELKKRENYRPDYEEVLFHFRQLQMYANNEAKVTANEVRQEYCWNHYISLVTENIHDMSASQDDLPSDQDPDEFNARDKGHMFSVARRSSWDNNSWQNSDIWALCRLGVSHNLRPRIWYDLLETQKDEDQCMELIKTDDDYDQNLTAYENLKIITVRYRNIAFAQIDEDMRLMDISNTPSRDDRGKIKNILK